MENREANLMIVSEAMIFRRGLRSILSREFAVNIIEASSPEDALLLASNIFTQAALIDAELPARSAFSLCRQLAASQPSTGVLILSDFDWDILLAEARKSGAVGFLTRQIGQEALLAAVEQARAGRILFTAAQYRRITLWNKEFGGRLASLTPREQDVLKLLEGGYRNKEMSQTLALTENTIEKHIGSILSKLGARSRAELLVSLYRNHVEFD